MITTQTHNGRPVIRLACKAFFGGKITDHLMIVESDGSVAVQRPGTDYFTSAHSLTPETIKRAHTWAGYGK
jgi:hypothetical protein